MDNCFSPFLPRDFKYVLKKNANFQLISFAKEGILPLRKGSLVILLCTSCALQLQ